MSTKQYTVREVALQLDRSRQHLCQRLNAAFPALPGIGEKFVGSTRITEEQRRFLFETDPQYQRRSKSVKAEKPAEAPEFPQGFKAPEGPGETAGDRLQTILSVTGESFQQLQNRLLSAELDRIRKAVEL